MDFKRYQFYVITLLAQSRYTICEGNGKSEESSSSEKRFEHGFETVVENPFESLNMIKENGFGKKLSESKFGSSFSRHHPTLEINKR